MPNDESQMIAVRVLWPGAPLFASTFLSGLNTPICTPDDNKLVLIANCIGLISCMKPSFHPSVFPPSHHKCGELSSLP